MIVSSLVGAAGFQFYKVRLKRRAKRGINVRNRISILQSSIKTEIENTSLSGHPVFQFYKVRLKQSSLIAYLGLREHFNSTKFD